jgi:hypothetical protein
MTDGTSASGTNQSGEWIGCVRGLRLRDPGPDADGAILEIHGEDGLAAMEFDDEAFVDGLTHTAAELKTALEACEVHTDSDDVDRGDGLRTDGGESASGVDCPGSHGPDRCAGCGERFPNTSIPVGIDAGGIFCPSCATGGMDEIAILSSVRCHRPDNDAHWAHELRRKHSIDLRNNCSVHTETNQGGREEP